MPRVHVGQQGHVRGGEAAAKAVLERARPSRQRALLAVPPHQSGFLLTWQPREERQIPEQHTLADSSSCGITKPHEYPLDERIPLHLGDPEGDLRGPVPKGPDLRQGV